MNFLTSTLAFLVAIGTLVAVHEFGHFIAARLLGVRVLRFSIGFGRPVWLHRAGPDHTEYCLSAIPFGGYVKLLDERDCPVALAEQGRTFNRQPVHRRMVILAAGPAFNFFFAVVAYWAMFMIGVPGMRPVVGEVTADSVAARAGLVAGDEIIEVGGTRIATWEGAVVAMLDGLLDNGRISLQLRRQTGGERLVNLEAAGRSAELTEPGRLFPGLGFAPWAPRLPAVIGEVMAGGTAARAGLRAGDRVLSADGQPVGSWPQWVEYVRARPGKTILTEVRRDGVTLELRLDVARADTEEGAVGRIGASPLVPAGLYDDMRAVERFGPVAAMGAAMTRTWEMSSLTLRMIARMLTGDVSVKNISGPINIAQYAGYSASVGLSPFLGFLAVVSLSLGILNLLPVPMLDGGQIAYQFIEFAKGSPLSERSQLIGQQVGIFLLLALMSFAFYNDISRLLG
ncbi:MAG: RIP metalloprotease RseP [Gammaproteobacteria bacterium]|nr:RIP metalloprotease RseP [Gammaproteobacteria bacterium]